MANATYAAGAGTTALPPLTGFLGTFEEHYNSLVSTLLGTVGESFTWVN